MAASSSFLCSQLSSQKSTEFEEKYDVFLSFRGEDTRDTFASYLYGALSAKQILTFMDDHELERGDEISPTLRKAIEESKICVIIFSENFASSTWCLDELVHILECKKRNEQNTVMPIFYGIDPSVVRKQNGSYRVAFAELQDRFKDRMEKVHQWRAALTEASNLCGLDSKNFRPECKLVQRIVEDISLKLPKYVSNEHFHGHGLIGIGEKVKEIELLLSIGSTDVRIVGIWGMGGIGKTTLASVVYQRLSYSQFEGYYFLSDVRKEYERIGANHLRKKLLSELLNDVAILKMDSPFVPSPFILDRLRRKKLLIVLDDVDSTSQLEALVQGYNWLSPGSRIIVTTRNVQVLKKVADRFYKVEGLNHIESLELFCLHAFGKNSSTIGYDDVLLERVARYANGNPLALKVLGSFLHSKSNEEWGIALDKLNRIPNPEIQNVLRISYEGLDDKGIQSTFLDIACLFDQSFTRDQAENMLETSDSFVKLGIRVLIDRSLIESSDSCSNNVLRMHDLLRKMGQAIVRDEHKEPGNRSRLWNAMDICQVLERNTGTAAVEGISFNLSKINRDVNVCPAALSKMYKLRILKIYDDNIFNLSINRWNLDSYCDNIGDNNFKLFIPQSFNSYDLSNKLRYFQWDLYPLKSLPSKFSLENLVELILRGSFVKKLWNHKIQPLPILRRMDLSSSRFLTQLPDLSQAPNLESINLEGCINLVQILSPLQNLRKLTYLNLSGCSNLRDIKEISRTTGHLDLVKIGNIMIPINNIFQLICTSLKSWTPSCMQSFMNNLTLHSSQAHIFLEFPKNLTSLLLRGTSIEEVPSSIGCVSGLVELDLGDCKRLKSLPTNICELKSLELLKLSGCLGLEKFPEILEPMENLTELDIGRAGIKGLPETIENLISLTQLNIQGCEGIEFLPNNLCNLRKLSNLYLHGTSIEEVPSSIGCLPGLEVLHLGDCKRLKSLPSNIYKLKSLQILILSGCLRLEKFPEILEPMENLDLLDISRAGIKGLPETIENLISLQQLFMGWCEGLEFLPNNLCNLRILWKMELQGCSKLEILPELPSSCRKLNAAFCTSLEKISSWRAPFLDLHESMHTSTFNPSRCFDFYGCKKLDHNSRNNIAVDCAVIRFLPATADLREDNLYKSMHRCKICYPGDEIPKWFIHQTSGPSMNIELPPYWNNDSFLGLALCLVFELPPYWNNKYDLEVECKLTFKTTNDDHPYEFRDYERLLEYFTSPDYHIFMWSVQKSILEQEMIGLNWSCTCTTQVSIHVKSSVDWRSENCEIKKLGIWLVYKEDIERFYAETKSKRKRNFDEYCEASGSCEVVGSHEDSDDDQSHPMIHSKKFKSM